jgi:hypothetical protein
MAIARNASRVCAWATILLLPNVDSSTAVAAGATPVAEAARVNVDGDVVSLAEAIRRASEDRRLIAYRELRAAHGDTVEGHIELARWCRRQGLKEEEQLHWRIVLSADANNAQAIKALQLRNFRGMLLTTDEIDDAKEKQRKATKAAKEWLPKLRKLRDSLENGDPAEQAAAMSELKSIQDPLAIPSLENIFPFEEVTFGMQIVELLEDIPDDEAATSLAAMAVEAENPYVRERAAEALKARPYHSYVPLLMAALAAPIEMSVQSSVDRGGPVFGRYEGYGYTGRLAMGLYNKVRLRSQYRQSDVMFWGLETKPVSGLFLSDYQPDRIYHDYVLTRDSPDPEAPYEYTGTIEGNRGPSKSRRKVDSIADVENKIKELNAATSALNARIHEALSKATGANVATGAGQPGNDQADVLPRAWWDWWRKHREVNHYFAKGVEVWTENGPLPIEQLMVGDRILARDAGTGELTFRLLIGLDTRSRAEVRTIEAGSRTVVSTAEQLFYVADVGWRRADELQPGMHIAGLGQPLPITNIRQGNAPMMYALVISDVPTFFVDRQGFLVQDATRR